MTSGGSKAKGSSFERDVGWWLSHWLTSPATTAGCIQKCVCGVAKTDLFRRTVLSGGQFSVYSGKKGEPGDLGPNDELAFPFCRTTVVEVKHWAFVDLHQFIRRSGELHNALIKVQGEAKEVKRSWILVVKQNQRATLIFMPRQVATSTLLSTVKSEWHILFSDNVFMMPFFEFIGQVNPVTYLSECGQYIQKTHGYSEPVV